MPLKPKTLLYIGIILSISSSVKSSNKKPTLPGGLLVISGNLLSSSYKCDGVPFIFKILSQIFDLQLMHNFTLLKFRQARAISLNSNEIFGLILSSIASINIRTSLFTNLPNSSSFFKTKSLSLLLEKAPFKSCAICSNGDLLIIEAL